MMCFHDCFLGKYWSCIPSSPIISHGKQKKETELRTMWLYMISNVPEVFLWFYCSFDLDAVDLLNGLTMPVELSSTDLFMPID